MEKMIVNTLIQTTQNKNMRSKLRKNKTGYKK